MLSIDPNTGCYAVKTETLCTRCGSPPGGNRWLTHWASLLRWIWSISEYNLKTRDSPKRTLKSGPSDWERRGSGPAKQKPKHNPCDWCCEKITLFGVQNHRHLDTRYLARVNLIVWNPKGIPTPSTENVKWYSSSQVSTAKHVSYPQLTATQGDRSEFMTRGWSLWPAGNIPPP